MPHHRPYFVGLIFRAGWGAYKLKVHERDVTHEAPIGAR
jgi:hypothetical protein